VCGKWLGILEAHGKIGKLASSHTRKDTGEENALLRHLSPHPPWYTKCLETRCLELIEPKLDDTQRSFPFGQSTTV